MSRRIAHLDMDAFFASVELLSRPELAGLPLVIGGSRPAGGEGPPAPEPLGRYRGRGVVTTATYPARAFGVHSGMPLMQAARLAPQALRLPPDFEAYKAASRAFKAAAATIAPTIEDRGIDEIYLDLSALPGVAEDGGRACAAALQAAVRAATGLSCSIAVAPNKLLAKLGSELDKPGGLTVLGPEDLATRIWPLPARKLNGIGPRAAEKLSALGMQTLGELAAADPAWLIVHFGPRYGAWLHEAAQGRDERPVVTHREPKSLSRETTFERNLHPRSDRAELGAVFTRLCERLAEDLRKRGLRAGRVGVKLRDADFRTLSREQTLDTPSDEAATLRRAAGLGLKRMPLDQPLRLLGVRASSLRAADAPETAPIRRRPPAGPQTAELFTD
ncbi:DNA polymerase IV [Piscinibacter sp. Jin2]|uniref:DNA polymerase IV n=1 Tax=Aquariibacter lacus TaxID=2801332 RepID=A0A9X0XF10_9BURK|nr:DNA polymerase IV [Piscinibacter lacus]MBL0720745.1 DNA polymerase IV [Piscinibacter lacus]